MTGTMTSTQMTPTQTNGFGTFIKANWFKIAFLCVFAVWVHRNDATIQFSMGGKAYIPPNVSVQDVSSPALMTYRPSGNSKMSAPIVPVPQKPVAPTVVAPVTDDNKSADKELFLDTDRYFGTSAKESPQVSKKKKNSRAYIKRFKATAISEMKKYGIPASITLAQGILESNVGISELATNNNNHFGIKCFSKSCGAGHCSNYHDDVHKDFFRKFNTAWESYRAHSLLLTGKRYRHLSKLKKTDYKGWAKGLQKAGYATSDRYAANLIQLIESLDLSQYDR